MGLKKQNLANTLSSPTRRTLTFEQAARLTTALKIIGGPEALLPTPRSNGHPHTR